MRRKDREITDIDKIETIIASARYMHLGMFDGEFPYIVPLHYGYQADIPCKYGADPPFASTVPPTGSPHILISAVPSDIKNSAVNIFRWNQPTS